MVQLQPKATLIMFVPAVIFFFLAVVRVEAREVSGNVDTKLDTYFVSKFVFEPNDEAMFTYEIKYPKFVADSDPGEAVTSSALSDIGDIQSANHDAKLVSDGRKGYFGPPKRSSQNNYYRLVMYNDDPGQWPYVRENEEKLTCLEKQQTAIDGGMVMISLSTEHGCVETVENGVPFISCRGYRTWKNYNRARWWFITFQNCGSYERPGLQQISYDFTMTNGDAYLTRHFSADEKIVLPTNIAFLCLFSGVIIAMLIFKYMLKIQHMLHSTFQLICLSAVVMFAGLTCLVVSQLEFARTGIMTLEWLETTGQVLVNISVLMFILNSILIAKGFTVTRGKISTCGCIKITIVMVLLTSATAIQYLYQYVLADERDDFNVNETPAAYAGIVLRIGVLTWIYYCISISVKHYPAKGRFYCYFGTFFTLWCISEPIMIFITNNAVASHSRAQIVNCAYMTTVFIGHLFWLVLFNPQSYNTLFPYHMRANQVGILQISEVENTPEKYFDGVATNEKSVACECETARDRGTFSKPIPKRNNFFPEAANNLEAGPGAANPVCLVTVPLCNLPVPETDWNIFLASGARTLVSTIPASPVGDKPTLHYEDEHTNSSVAATSTPAAAATGKDNSVVPIYTACQLPVPKTDWNIFLASSCSQIAPVQVTDEPAKVDTAVIDLVPNPVPCGLPQASNETQEPDNSKNDDYSKPEGLESSSSFTSIELIE